MNSGVYILLAEPHEHHRHLGRDDEVVGAKQAVAVAPGDARAGRPADCPGIPGPLRNVQEGQGAGFRWGSGSGSGSGTSRKVRETVTLPPGWVKDQAPSPLPVTSTGRPPWTAQFFLEIRQDSCEKIACQRPKIPRCWTHRQFSNKP